jgi:3-dehydroquinate synthase
MSRMSGAGVPAGHPAHVPTRIDCGGAPVIIGTGVLGELAGLVGGQGAGPGGGQQSHAVTSVFVIHAAGLGEIVRPVCSILEKSGFTVHAEPVPDGEAAKEAGVLARLWSRMAEHRLTRSDAIVGIGGGAATDLAGFAAATWLRGVRLVLVPTTLLAMVDAAIGGKTAVNIPEGKNLVGAFHPPAGVLCDLTTLVSLPRADYVSGLAEIIKAGFIADPAILDLIESDPEGAGSPDGPHTRELVERAVRMKAGVVSSDPREAGRREILNYGHTLGHAIERVEEYRFRHGDAVAIGMCYAAALARLAGRLDEAVAARHARLLASAGLPTSYLAAAWPQLREAMAVDKKSRGARLRLVVLDGLARPGILEDPPEGLLAGAYAEVAA